MRWMFGIAVLAAGAAAVSAAAQPTPAGKPMRDASDATSAPVGMASAKTLGSFNTTAYVQNAARGDMYETQSSELALKRSHSDKVKAFAREMIKDHKHTTAELKSTIAATSLKVTPPVALDNRRRGMVDNLRTATAAEFDRRYLMQQRAAHEEALALQQGFAAHGDNDALKALAAKTAPMVDEHLTKVKALAS